MPLYATTRLTLTGPHSDLTRFQHECIRLQRDDHTGTPSLDFEVLVPIPPEIVATLHDDSNEVQHAALAATGHKDWHGWSIANWGTKWNTTLFDGRAVNDVTYDCVFNTAGSYPEQALKALAARYPSLSGAVVAKDLSDIWWLVSTIQSGTYTCVTSALHPPTDVVVHGGYLQGKFGDYSAHTLVKSFTNEACKLGTNVDWNTWNDRDEGRGLKTISTALAQRHHCSLSRHFRNLSRRLYFVSDTMELIESSKNGKSPHQVQESDWNPDPDRIGNVTFFLANGRTSTLFDQNLLFWVACDLLADAYNCCDAGKVNTSLYRTSFESFVKGSCEIDLWDWAAKAMYLPGINLDLSSTETLAKSFYDYADGLVADLLIHLSGGEQF